MPTTSSVFVDTSGWADTLARTSPDHAAMEAYYRQLIATKRRLITTNYVMTELVALLTARSRLTRPQLLTLVNRIRGMPRLTIIHVDAMLDAAAWAPLEQYDDKDWSLVDAASFVVMRQRGIIEAFTTDHHFAQAGFVRVPV
jgi:predicted nucleic acid-binding protein